MSRILFPLFFIITIIFASTSINASNLDSLQRLLKNNKLQDSNQVNLLNFIADVFEETASDSCLYYARKALNISQSINYHKGTGAAYNSIGSYYNGKGEYQLALANFIDGYKVYEKIHNKRAMSNLMNSMGNTYVGINNTKRAFEAYSKSYEIASIDSIKYMMGISSIGLGNIQLLDKRADKALEFFLRAKNIFSTTQNSLYPLSVSYTLIGDALIELDKFDEAFINFNIAIEKLKTLDNSYGIAATYNVMGKAYLKKGDSDKALDYFLKSYSIFIERNAFDDLQNVSLSISNIYKQKNDFEKALQYFSSYNNFKDSVFNSTNNKQLLEVEAKYETGKKEQEIEVQRLKLKEQTFQRNVLITSVVLIILILILLYNRYNVKRKAHGALSIANHNLEIKNNIIVHKNTEITDSIKYAQRIQNAIFPSMDSLDKWLPQYFVLFNPKDIVSGDFYWATEYNNKFYLAVCDCTGHGVPGAFMSLLNVGFLNEAIKEKNITEPNEILNFVRKRLIESIGSDGQQDGMDAILICLDINSTSQKGSRTLTYAAANNEPVLIRDNKLLELPKDKMPVGKGEKTENFTSYSVELQQGDSLYLYTDGYADQFGGPKGKKFKYKPLNNLLLSVSTLEMQKQKMDLLENLNSWKGDLEQVDDICIVGIKM
jgi:serine phosphatase RsbU (regulator of sigma subunit)